MTTLQDIDTGQLNSSLFGSNSGRLESEKFCQCLKNTDSSSQLASNLAESTVVELVEKIFAVDVAGKCFCLK